MESATRRTPEVGTTPEGKAERISQGEVLFIVSCKFVPNGDFFTMFHHNISSVARRMRKFNGVGHVFAAMDLPMHGDRLTTGSNDVTLAVSLPRVSDLDQWTVDFKREFPMIESLAVRLGFVSE